MPCQVWKTKTAFILFKLLRHSIVNCRISQRDSSIWRIRPGRMYWNTSNRLPELNRRRIKRYKYRSCSHDWLSLHSWECFSCWRSIDYDCNYNNNYRSKWWAHSRTWSSGTVVRNPDFQLLTILAGWFVIEKQRTGRNSEHDGSSNGKTNKRRSVSREVAQNTKFHADKHVKQTQPCA